MTRLKFDSWQAAVLHFGTDTAVYDALLAEQIDDSFYECVSPAFLTLYMLRRMVGAHNDLIARVDKLLLVVPPRLDALPVQAQPPGRVFVGAPQVQRCPECNTLGTAHSPNCPNRSR